MNDRWKMERNGGGYQVQVFDLDGTPFIDREVATFMEACLLVEGTHEEIMKVLATSSNQEQE